MAVWPNGSSTIPRVTAEFGPYDPFGTGTSMHNGIDLVDFDVVCSPVSGTIIYADYNGSAGNEVRIRADVDGSVHRLLHNRSFIRTGGTVSEGTPVAYQGATGEVTGKHTHYEIWATGQRGSAVNPRIWMQSHIAQADVGAGQRTANAVVNRRREATSASAIAGEPLQPGDVGNFEGWKRGESVEGNNVWFQGTSGNWFWSGGFEEGANTAGLKDLNPAAPPAVSPTQRVVGGDTVNRRIGDASSSAPAGEPLAPGDVGNFTHWTRGESVSGNDIWFKGTSGDYFWSGGFVGGANTSGLPEEVRTPAPAPIGPQQRRVKASDSVNGRTDHNTGAAIVQSLAPGTVGDFKAYAEGQAVEGNNIWFQGAYAGNWFWSGAFEGGANTAGLPKADGSTPAPAPAPAPTPAPKPTPDYKNFTADTQLAKWVGSPNFNYREPRPAGQKPKHITLHWMTSTLEQTDAHFQNTAAGSASNYGVGPKEIHQYVREQDYQQADGNAESNRWGISVEHEMGPTIPIADSTINLSASLLADISKRNGLGELVWMKNVFPHSHFVATQCPGTLPYAEILKRANAILSPNAPTTPTTPEPKPADPPTPGDTVEVDRGWLGSIWEKIGKILGK